MASVWCYCLKHSPSVMIAFFLLSVECVLFSAANNVTYKLHDDFQSQNEVRKESVSPTVAVYVNNDGEMIKIEEFLKSAKDSSSQDKEKSVVISSCRNYAMQVEKENIEGLDIESAADNLASHLRKISNYELGVTEMQTIYDSLPFKNVRVNYKEQIEMIAGHIKKKIGNYVESLDKNKRYVEELYIHHLWSQPIVNILSCYQIDRNSVNFSQRYGTNVNSSKSCELTFDLEPTKDFGFSPGRNLTKLFSQNRKLYPFMKWQYFITSKGIHSEYPAYSLMPNSNEKISYQNNELRHNDIYLSTIYPTSKLVVILIDKSNSMTEKQFQLSKNISIGILNSLSENDYVGLLTVDNSVYHPYDGQHLCTSDVASPIVGRLKKKLASCIERLEKATFSFGANHSLGLQKSFEMIYKSVQRYGHAPPETIQPVIIYVSRGLLWNLHKGKAVLKLIAEENKKLNNSVIVNTCAVVDNLRPVLNEKQFLKMVAEQRNSNNLTTTSKNVRAGKVIEFSSVSDLRASVNELWLSLKQASDANTFFSLPKWDSIGNEVVISMAKPCFHMRNVIGMVGVDLHLNDFAEDINFFTALPSAKSYVFVVHKSGYVVAHSLLGDLKTLNAASSLIVDIANLQRNVLNFASIRKELLNDYVGQRKLKLKKHLKTNETFDTQSQTFTHAVYTWRRIDGSPFTACIVVYENNNSKHKMKKLHVEKSSCNDYVRYHRLDINPPRKHSGLCRNADKLISLKTSTLYLSPSSFSSPYKYLSQSDTKEKLNSYLGYLCDTTNLIPNPGMKPNVRSDVAAVIRITEYWREQVTISQLNDYVVRRYVGLPSGVVHAFPGMVMNKDYDVIKQDWYLKALEHTGKVVVSAPFSKGDSKAGNTVTLSHTIYEGKHASLHSTSDSVIAVMGMDLTLGYIHQLLLTTIPICRAKSMRCFIFDDKGYLVTHPNLVKSGGRDKNFDHITHGEQLIANDILCHEGFVEKWACKDYQAETVQRSYKFNSKWQGVLTNLVHGEHCARYQITVIPGSNLFLGVINQTCGVRIAFCSCSTMDRLCLNCNRMEQTECECPCECPLNIDDCNGESTSDVEMCHQVSQDPMMAEINYTVIKELDSCVDIDCFSRKTHRNCFGVIGCVWCEQNFDGTYLQQPFCTDQMKCYQGILVNQAAYRGNSYNSDQVPQTTTPVAAVAGGIMAFFILLIFFVYFTRKFRQRNDPGLQSNISTYVLPPNDNAFKMLTFDNDPDECIDEPIQPLNPQGMLLADFQNVSPYRMNSTYRRPTGGESSDHGYSTMTPHEDSVHNGLSYSEQLIPINNRNSDTTQSVTSFGSETSAAPSSAAISPSPIVQTVIPSDIDPKHGTKFLAHVQVHMVEC